MAAVLREQMELQRQTPKAGQVERRRLSRLVLLWQCTVLYSTVVLYMYHHLSLDITKSHRDIQQTSRHGYQDNYGTYCTVQYLEA